MKLNLGCGHEPLPGYVNVDAYAVEADIKGDLLQLNFRGAEKVLMSHVLEHISWRDTDKVLRRVRSWMFPDAELTVEVPDMDLIAEQRDRNPDWIRYFYGSQEHEGEVHRTGFTLKSLRDTMFEAGFDVVLEERFFSGNPHRVGMPCLLMVGRA